MGMNHFLKILVAAFFFLSTISLSAAEVTVNGTDRAALDAAINAAAVGDVILINQTIEFGGSQLGISKKVTFRGVGSGIEIKSAEDYTWRFFDLVQSDGDGKIVFENLTFSGAYNDGNQTGGETSGGIARLLGGSKVDFTNCKFVNNYALDRAGALYLEGTEANFTNCEFTGNTAKKGGAVWSGGNSNVTFRNCKFASNGVTVGGDRGGALFVEGTSQTGIYNSVFTGNYSSDTSEGGGVFATSGTAALYIEGSAIYGNHCYNSHGGILFAMGTASITFVNTTIADNTMHKNANSMFFYSDNGHLTFVNVSFLNNHAGETDGPDSGNTTGIRIANSASRVKIYNSLVVGNVNRNGIVDFNLGGSVPAAVADVFDIQNSIIGRVNGLDAEQLATLKTGAVNSIINEYEANATATWKDTETSGIDWAKGLQTPVSGKAYYAPGTAGDAVGRGNPALLAAALNLDAGAALPDQLGKIRAIDGDGAVCAGAVEVIAAYAGTPYLESGPQNIPGIIEAEYFDNGGQNVAYYDTEEGRRGGDPNPIRPDEWIEIDPIAGGYNVGYIEGDETGQEWMKYTVTVRETGLYTVKYRSSGGGPAKFKLLFDDEDIIGELSTTGGDWSVYKIDEKADIPLIAGTYVMKFIKIDGGLNLDYIEFVSQKPYEGTAYPDGTPHPVPGVIQAEHFDDGGEGVAYHDSDPGHHNAELGQSNPIREDSDVEIEACTDCGDDNYNIGFAENGEWLKYTVNVEKTGVYDIDFYAASGNGGSFTFAIDNRQASSTVTVPETGGWQVWEAVPVTGVELSKGVHVITVNLGGGFNFDRFEINLQPYAGTAYPDGTPHPIPGIIEAEDFDDGGEGVAYHDQEPGHQQGGTIPYRPEEGVEVEGSEGNYNIGFTGSGEWLKYTFSAATAGTYVIKTYASAGASGSFHLLIDDEQIGEDIIVNTGGWGTYNAFLSDEVEITAGTHVLTWFTNGGTNLDKFEFVKNVADLIVTSLTWEPASPVIGDDVIFTATVKNVGGAATRPVAADWKHGVRFHVNNTATTWCDSFNETDRSIAPDEEVVLTANGGPGNSASWVAREGTFTIKAQANDTENILESDYTNNTLEVQLIVQGTGINPVSATGKVYAENGQLRIEGYPATASVTVYNLLAQKVVHFNAIAENGNVNLPAGTYIVQIQCDGKPAIHKVLVK
jgi:hypothetical protein